MSSLMTCQGASENVKLSDGPVLAMKQLKNDTGILKRKSEFFSVMHLKKEFGLFVYKHLIV